MAQTTFRNLEGARDGTRHRSQFVDSRMMVASPRRLLTAVVSALLLLVRVTSFTLNLPSSKARLFAHFATPTANDDGGGRKVSILVCPAQFCVPADYEVLFDMIKKEIGAEYVGTCMTAPLPRTEWIKVARSLPTEAYLSATLPVYSTLSWYFDAIEDALAEIFTKDGQDTNICFIGHSIGGWVARAYLGGLSR